MNFGTKALEPAMQCARMREAILGKASSEWVAPRWWDGLRSDSLASGATLQQCSGSLTVALQPD
jgi:hypothetical protein